MRRLQRGTVVAAGVVSGILLSWALSPILNSRHTAQVTIRVDWRSGQKPADAYRKALVREAFEYGRLALRSNATQPQHFQGIGFGPWRNNELKFFITTEDPRLSRTAVRETVAYMDEWSTALPGGPRLSIVPSVWNDLSGPPNLSVAAAGIVCGLLAGGIMAARLPQG